MSYPAANIANYFLDRANREMRALTPMQLLKLVYIAHGWNLGYYGQPLIREKVQAWKFGPVIQELYDRIKHFGRDAVRGYVSESPFSSPELPRFDASTQQLLDYVWSSYGSYSGIQLSNMTHQPGTPWDQAWRNCGGRSYAPIDNELIKQFYREKVNAEVLHA